MSRASQHDGLQQVDGQVIVDAGRVTEFEVEKIYRQFAVLCIDKQVRRVLVRPGDADPAAERALRVALTSMVLAGLPSGFKLALVVASAHIEARYRDTERDLRMAGVETKIFPTDDGASRWLRESRSPSSG